MGRGALVLAAGMSKRFRMTAGTSKQAATLSRIPLICYPLTSLALSGVSEVMVVTAPGMDSTIRHYALSCPASPEVEVITVSEPWRGNGYTFAVAAWTMLNYRGRTCSIVSMMDHVYPPSLAERVASSGCNSVGVDYEARYVDRGEATRVAFIGGVLALGKHLPTSNPVDVGVHMLSADVAMAAFRCSFEGEIGLSDVITCASRLGVDVRLADVTGTPWSEVDNLDDLRELEAGRRRAVLDSVLGEWRSRGAV